MGKVGPSKGRGRSQGKRAPRKEGRNKTIRRVCTTLKKKKKNAREAEEPGGAARAMRGPELRVGAHVPLVRVLAPHTLPSSPLGDEPL